MVLRAQQEAMFSHYMWNGQTLNPAETGERGSLNATLIHRSQWVGFDGAPLTQSLVIDAPVAGDWVNLGLSVVHDKTGPVRNVGLMADYAFRVRLSEDWRLSLGAKVGFNNYVFNLSSLRTLVSDVSFLRNDNEFDFNAGVGLKLSNRWFDVGIALPRLVENGFDYSVNGVAEEVRHYYVTLGGRVPLPNKFELRPTSLVKVTGGAPVECDITLTCRYDDTYWFGVMGRTGDGLGLTAGLWITGNLALGYAFDWSIANTTSETNYGSHEVMLHYKLTRSRGKGAGSDDRDDVTSNICISEEQQEDTTGHEATRTGKEEGSEERLRVYEVVVQNARTGKPIEGARVSVGEDAEGETNEHGETEVAFLGDSSMIDVEALGYEGQTFPYSGKEERDTVRMTVLLDMSIILRDIYYDFDKSEIRPESEKELNKVLVFMRSNPDLYIELSSHTDSRGNDEYNMALSERRAASAVRYLTEHGCDPSRIRSRGYGESRLLNKCSNGVRCPEEEHQMNRRTEIRISEVDGGALETEKE